MTKPTDSALIASARAGSQSAFGTLVRRYQGGVRALLLRLTKQQALADDLAQETFLLAWEKLGQMRGDAFRPWVSRIAYTKFLQHQRKRSKVGTPNLEPAQVACNQSQALDIADAMDQLPAAQCTALALAVIGGQSHSEIAATTGWPLGSVKSHIRRGQEQLRNLLQDYQNA